jgi:putative hemolysin
VRDSLRPEAALSRVLRRGRRQARRDGAPDPGPREEAPLDPRAAIRVLPPLIKGYWRLGAKFGPQAEVDESFAATDVFAVMPVAEIKPRYLAHLGERGAEAALAA